MLTTHTPGPWSAWAPETDGGKWQIDAHSPPMAPRPKIATLHSGVPYTSCTDLARERAAANAALIAAAPDMHKALKKIRRILFHAAAGGARSKPTIAQLNEILDLAGYALVKAEGK